MPLSAVLREFVIVNETVSGARPDGGDACTFGVPPVVVPPSPAVSQQSGWRIAMSVFGPRTPQPVVSGSPDEMMPCGDCHSWTADSVWTPKKPVTEPEAKSPSAMRKFWRAITSAPFKPRYNLRVTALHARWLYPGVPSPGANTAVSEPELLVVVFEIDAERVAICCCS